MHVLVTGGTGTLGQAFVSVMEETGHTLRLASRHPPSDGTLHEWVQVDLSAESSDALGDTLSGVDAVLHSATQAGFGSKSVDVEGTRRLVRAAERVGIEHFVYPSIVGIDQMPFRYYRMKQQAERIVRESEVPHTILRATQFHELIDLALSALAWLPVMFVPTDFRMQPVAARDVALRLRQCLETGPAEERLRMGGPEVLTGRELVETWLEVQGKQKPIVRLPLPGQTAQGFREGAATVPEQAEGEVTWRAWLRNRYAAS